MDEIKKQIIKLISEIQDMETIEFILEIVKRVKD